MEAAINISGNPTRQRKSRAFEVRVPATTANLGAGFDCCGLALELYLTVRAWSASQSNLQSNEACRVRMRGEGRSSALPRATENLIYRAMLYVADAEGLSLPSRVRLAVHNEIPLASGLGSSGAAIVAGAVLCAHLCERDIPFERLLRHVTAFEGHADNVAASLYGGWVVNCMKDDGSVFVVKRSWTRDIKIIIVTPHLPLETERARLVLPNSVPLKDAVHNLQRASLFNAAMEIRRYDLLWEAMQDRLHQPHRQNLVPGLAAALATPPLPGLIGVALSGAGPSVLALAQHNFDEIGTLIKDAFCNAGVDATTRLLDVDTQGVRIKIR